MKETITVVKRSWFYRLIRAIAMLQLIWLGACMVDLVLHPIAPDVGALLASTRLITGFISVPVILLIAGLILRRTNGNIVGWLLLMMAETIGQGTLRPQAFGGYANDLRVMGFMWPAIWSIPIFFPDGRVFPRRIERLIQVLVIFLFCSLIADSLANPVHFNEFASTPKSAETVNRLYIPLLAPLQ